MKVSHCDREQDVVNAMVSARWGSAWGEELRRHAATCEACSEVALACQAFQQEVELARAEPGQTLPSAGLIWWKAQLAARRAAEYRAALPILWVERLMYVFGVASVLALGARQWPRLIGWLQEAPGYLSRSFAVPGHPEIAQSLDCFAGASTQSTTLVYAGAAAFLTFVVLAVYAVWREE